MKNIIVLIFLLPLLFSCQKYKNKPYDDYEESLRKAHVESTKGITIDNDWAKRDSLSYLRFNEINNIYIESLDSIPAWIGNFRKLTFLSTTVANSKFSKIPKDIKNLNNLININLSRSRLSEIPKELKGLILLKSLDLGSNNIKILSDDSFKNFVNLESLSLENNIIAKIPSSICNLSKLKYLEINNTNIKKLPRCLSKLPELKIIFISNTNITEFQIEILSAPKLKTVHAKGLHLKNYKEVKAICEKRNITFYYDE